MVTGIKMMMKYRVERQPRRAAQLWPSAIPGWGADVTLTAATASKLQVVIMVSLARTIRTDSYKRTHATPDYYLQAVYVEWD